MRYPNKLFLTVESLWAWDLGSPNQSTLSHPSGEPQVGWQCTDIELSPLPHSQGYHWSYVVQFVTIFDANL